MKTMAAAQKRRANTPREDRIFFAVIYAALLILLIVILYPLVYVVSSSFSSPSAVLAGKVRLLPVDFSLEGYRTVFQNKNIWIGYQNTIIYTVTGTIVNVFMTMVCAYPLARKDLPYQGPIMMLFTFTVFFSGGMIPNYILMKNLNLIDNRLVMILPGMISVYNMIIARTFLRNTIPAELLEASQVDGCSDVRFFLKIALPISKACLAVTALYYAVGHWNAYFNAFMYLNDRNLYPLALFLREILISNQLAESMNLDADMMEKLLGLADVLKYALIVVSTAPILLIYPFAQKYFVQGVMIGAVKG